MNEVEITDELFEQLIADSLDELPHQYVENMKNVAIVWADEPTREQREKLKLQCNQTLYGLYEGVSLPRRQGRDSIIPDKITIFRGPIVAQSQNLVSLKAQVKHTLWHEIAHHYGLDHYRIHEIENTRFRGLKI
jgi:predicted Zn-dependent protease with MMP-like domain